MKISVRVRPGAKADAVGGRWDGPRGTALLVAVRARAVEGAANTAVVTAVAAAFGLRRGAVELAPRPTITGCTSATSGVVAPRPGPRPAPIVL